MMICGYHHDDIREEKVAWASSLLMIYDDILFIKKE